MSFESNKTEVLDLFHNYLIRYIVKDLEVLDSIKPDAWGGGLVDVQFHKLRPHFRP